MHVKGLIQTQDLD